ncbi:Probable RNA-directed DNA polymerase from transposon BS [Eumeta japonica]|uniref:Probable RNA-directed DNA polymerase from transposon BS n=1 Tax=Eumeta variegata TaxID=151549 RepID=A0A4C1X7B7_EUMVA|nr:Probable RNA-directed DNA polymerase from transposon BS [Eumeta japonica]
MEEIKPSHKAFWAVTKALKTEGYTPIPPLKKPDNSEAIDDAEIAECLADSIETQCSHASPPHDIAHISRIEEEVLQKTSLEPKDDLAPVSLSEVQTLVKSLNTRRHRASMEAEVIGIHKPGNHATSCQLQTDQPPERPFLSTASPPLSRVCLGGFETERSTVAVFFDVAKAFDRVWHAANRHFTFRHERTHSTRRLIRAGVPQGSTLSPLLYSAYTNDVPRPSSSGVQLALFADDTALFTEIGIGAPDSPSSPQRAIDELGQWFRKWRIEVNPTNQQPYNSSMDGDDIRVSRLRSRRSKALHRLQVIQNKFCRAATDAHWCVRNSILHRDLELPTISKYMKDASKRFFDIAGSHPNALLRAAVDYQPPHPTLSSGHRPKLPYSTRPPLTASGRGEPTRDGFLRHPMPRRLPPGVVHSACHAPSALACAVRPHSVKLSKSSDLSSDSSRPTK